MQRSASCSVRMKCKVDVLGTHNYWDGMVLWLVFMALILDVDVFNGFLNPTETVLYVSAFGGTDTAEASSTFEHVIILLFVSFFRPVLELFLCVHACSCP